jgi:transcriptional regulator with XRE-family HTH domain
MPLSRTTPSIIGRRLRERREALGWSLERVGVEIGLDESSARARISRYELGVHQPAEETALLLARALQVPHAFLHCEDDRLAKIILAASALSADKQKSLLASLQIP